MNTSSPMIIYAKSHAMTLSFVAVHIDGSSQASARSEKSRSHRLPALTVVHASSSSLMHSCVPKLLR